MKNVVLAVGAIVAVVAVLGWVYRKPIALAFASKETRACAKMAELCAPEREASSSDLDTCHNAFTDLRKVATEKDIDKSLTCIEDANTCARATGCMIGGVGVGVAKELLDGIGDALRR